VAEERDPRIPAFVASVLSHGRELYRDHPWRRTRDPYAVLLSEVMLQQTQVARVVGRWGRWLERFPTLDALAAAPLADVLAEWQGLGYNRRAIALKRLAEQVVAEHAASGAPGEPQLPCSERALLALPGVGPATAAGVRAFAFGEPSLYLETNVRAVVLQELFADADGVRDAQVVPLLHEALDVLRERGVSPRDWYYALLDYGAHLKRTHPNPSRRSAHHARQSRFEGSRRQKRARLLRVVLEEPGLSAGELAGALGLDLALAEEILRELAAEGFVAEEPGGADGVRWRVPE
jgi:A/G-specific adenine glycosylase